jgi:hypothetical protein
MRRMVGWLAVGLVGLTGTALAQAQPAPQRGPMQCPMTWSPSSIDTVTGEIVGISTMGGMMGGTMGGMGRSVVLMVRTADGVVAIHVAPLSYLQQQDVNFKLGDNVSVRGARMEFEGMATLIATNITQSNGRSLALRSDQGVPVWRAQGPPTPMPVPQYGR